MVDVLTTNTYIGKGVIVPRIQFTSFIKREIAKRTTPDLPYLFDVYKECLGMDLMVIPIKQKLGEETWSLGTDYEEVVEQVREWCDRPKDYDLVFVGMYFKIGIEIQDDLTFSSMRVRSTKEILEAYNYTQKLEFPFIFGQRPLVWIFSTY